MMRPRHNGQALTEFALVLPVLMLVLGAILQFGLIFTSQIGITNSVREAARYGSVLSGATADSTAQANGQAVMTHLVGGSGSIDAVDPDAIDATGCGPSGLLATNVHPFICSLNTTQPGLASATVAYCKYQNPSSGSGTYSVRISVSVVYNHPLYIPVVANIIDALDGGTTPGSFQLVASEQMRVENVPTLDAAALDSMTTSCT